MSSVINYLLYAIFNHFVPLLSFLSGVRYSYCRSNNIIRFPKDVLFPLTMPNHDTLKGSTLRVICGQSGIKRKDFLRIYQQVEFLIL